MDIRLLDAEPTAEERSAVDAIIGAPSSSWDGGERGSERDAHTAEFGGRATRELRHMLLPLLQAVQARVGFISEGGLDYVCERLGVPPAEAWGVATFYAMLATSPRPRRVVHVCDDIACRAKGAVKLCAALEAKCGPPITHEPEGEHHTLDRDKPAWMHSPCLGLCDVAPAALMVEAGESLTERSIGGATAEGVSALLTGKRVSGADGADQPHVVRSPRISRGGLLERVCKVDPTSLAAYRAAGGYAALAKAFELGAEGVIREVTASKLVGRGGAAFPTGRKWEAVRTQAAQPHYLVCNADESEPGTFKDRVLLTEDPFAIVEAMTIGAFAAGAEKGFLYIRAEYPLAFERMHDAIGQARAAGLLGDDILGRGVKFDIEIRRGAGAYICGEETALFESIEGKRGEPRNKPPFPVSHGLFGKPTAANNVETFANIPAIVLEGGAAFARVGTEQSTGTRLFCLSGTVRRPGVYEVPFGTTLRELIDMAGGVPEGRTLKAVLLGGAAGVFVRGDELDIKLTHEDTRATGTTLGSGVVMLFDDTCDVRDAVLRIAAFFRDESCGQCVPCRVGTVRQEEALHRITSGKTRGGVRGELALLHELGEAMKDGSICGLGQTAYSAVESAITRLGLYAEPGSATA
ncbi:MAG TPA: NAD(P)H-dependent oxidoreductase subunit E [Gemmatimonadaceae bacterium]|jgi:NADH-quinone oxidoreductase subunit F|nr:NAD(P)H-dependent oxidoreductase subunit E [Gemmatimonadaceae bacterium]